MANAYLKLKQKRDEEFNNFPMVFAFNDKQFEEGMKKLGLEPSDTDKVYKGFSGGFYRKTDAEALTEMLLRFDREMKEAIENDKTGEGYIFDMFSYELANHEYTYTMEITSTLEAVGLTLEEVKASENLSKGLEKAIKYALEQDN